jgi:hypothetical protein
MESLSQDLMLREIFGLGLNIGEVSCRVTGFERIFIGKNRIQWVQAKDNFIAFLARAGGLTVYNTLKKSEVFQSNLLGQVLKVWFFKDTLLMIVKVDQEILVYQLLLNTLSVQDFHVQNFQNNPIKLLKKLEISGIEEIDVSEDLIILKNSSFFQIINLDQKSWKIQSEGNSRYSKGFILSDLNGKITIINVKTLQVHSFLPNFSNIFHIDIISSTVFCYNEESFCSFNLHSRSFKVFSRCLYKYFEIENSGESLLVFSDTSSLMTPEEVQIPSCEDVISLTDNKEHIFILNSFSLFLVRKIDYLIQVILLNSPFYLIGCNENDCEFFLADEDSLKICLF